MQLENNILTMLEKDFTELGGWNMALQYCKDIIDSLIKLSEGGSEVERLAAYSSLLFLYNEDCDPISDEISSFKFSLTTLLKSLHFDPAISERVSANCYDILKNYKDNLWKVKDFEERRRIATNIKHIIKDTLKKNSDKLVNMHLKRLHRILSNLSEDHRKGIAELANSLASITDVNARFFGLKLSSSDIDPLVKAVGEISLKRMFPHMEKWRVSSYLESLSLCLEWYWSSRKHYYSTLLILPVVFTDNFFSLLKGFPAEEKIVIKEEVPAFTSLKYEGKTPSKEILESIVKDVLQNLGFKVRTNKRLKGRGGGEIEVDVWGYKPIGLTKFFVYASCKNWSKEVDRQVIDTEFGRTQQLDQIPHLKIFVAKRLTGPALKTALADGFIVIELKEKATTKNAAEIYDIIYRYLKEIFIGIAPPELQRFAKEAEEISERLKQLAEEIRRVV